MPNPLEYEEESEHSDADLFGSDPEDDGGDDDVLVDKRKPVPARAPPVVQAKPETSSASQPARPTVEQRIEELRKLHARPSPPPNEGVPSLKWHTMRG